MGVLHTKLMEASQVLREVRESERFQEEREWVHVGIIGEAQEAVKVWGGVKVAVVVLVVLAQVVMVRRWVKGREDNVKPWMV